MLKPLNGCSLISMYAWLGIIFWVIIEGFIAVGGDSYLLKSFYCNERSAPEASKLDGANKCHKTI